MSYEIQISIPKESKGGHLIASISGRNGLTPSEAAKQIIEQAAVSEPKAVANNSILTSPTELVAQIRARRPDREDRVPSDPSGSEALIGMLAGDKEFGRIMDEIIASRPKRYGFEK